MKNRDELRIAFEAGMPPPPGVAWNQDHYTGSTKAAGSFRNATTWQDMYRGFLLAAEVLNKKAP